MARGLNRVVLIGHVGRRPELRTTGSGARVATFSVATNRPPLGGERERTEWHRIVAWDDLAEWAAKRLDRGSRVYVEGRIESRGWSDRSGRQREMTEIVAHDVIVFEGRASGAEGTPAEERVVRER